MTRPRGLGPPLLLDLAGSEPEEDHRRRHPEETVSGHPANREAPDEGGGEGVAEHRSYAAPEPFEEHSHSTSSNFKSRASVTSPPPQRFPGQLGLDFGEIERWVTRYLMLGVLASKTRHKLSTAEY